MFLSRGLVDVLVMVQNVVLTTLTGSLLQIIYMVEVIPVENKVPTPQLPKSK